MGKSCHSMLYITATGHSDPAEATIKPGPLRLGSQSPRPTHIYSKGLKGFPRLCVCRYLRTRHKSRACPSPCPPPLPPPTSQPQPLSHSPTPLTQMMNRPLNPCLLALTSTHPSAMNNFTWHFLSCYIMLFPCMAEAVIELTAPRFVSLRL